ncbi:exported hypothetical protein [Xanthomonas citri pv. citri]|nr:exported hypothetical protein [Xanthomonas citri pv. citri]CEE43886.1 exported hypothetical protein [Xanthomonas citri pv. citri]CEE64398.1 exported hypothetical protein [Xanthomonas citri pv. citri]CEE82444.1 exported hypothetical protein [Xanthomonas citri pv. citri]CEF46022.1 exported hypothetical protein [Xanthomonas citri pv. citri]
MTTSPLRRLPLLCACLLALGPFSLTADAAATGVDASIRTTQNTRNASDPLFRYQWHPRPAGVRRPTSAARRRSGCGHPAHARHSRSRSQGGGHR